jgi:hypothetical protein
VNERWIITPIGGRAVVLPTTPVRSAARVTEIRTPPPAPRSQWVQVQEGQLLSVREFENREVSLRIELARPRDSWWDSTHDFGDPPPEAAGDGDLLGWRGSVRLCGTEGQPLEPVIADAAALVAALQRGGGTATRVLPSGNSLTFDVLTAADPDGPAWDISYYAGKLTHVPLVMTCAPFARGAETALAGPGGTTSVDLAAGQRFAVFNGLDVPGDVEALTRVEVTSLGSRDRDSVLVAIDRPDPVVAAIGAQVAASNRRLPATATTSAPVATGALSVSTVKLGALVAGRPAGVWEPCVYLETASAAMPLKGTFRMLARVAVGGWSPTSATRGSLRLRLRWADGSASLLQTNPEQTLIADGEFGLVDLGLVEGHAQNAKMRGVIERAGDTGATLEIDTLHPIPIDVHAVAAASLASPTMTLAAIDNWATGSTTLNGRASTGGSGAWSVQGTASGSTWTVDTASSSAVHSAGGLQAATVPVAAGQARYRVSALMNSLQLAGQSHGVIIGNTGGIAAVLSGGTPGATDWAVHALIQQVAGGTVCYAYAFGPGMTPRLAAVEVTPPISMPISRARINLEVSTRGVACWLGDATSPTVAESELPGLIGTSPRAGLLAGSATTVSHSQFVALSALGDLDHALHAGKTTRIASDGASRVDAANDRAPMARYGGDRPKLLPSSSDGLKSRVIVGAMSGGGVTGQPDVAPSEGLRVEVFATPRWLQLPDLNRP